jgi:tryptophanyl-tRNA synthetase
MRPTGRLHIGHYFGALQNWVRLQNDPSYDCFYFIADWHALTSDYANSNDPLTGVARYTLEIATDYLAVGLDPKKSVIFQQSQIPEHAELHLLLSMVTPLGWLERVPTYKEALENVKDRDLHTYGFLGYPVLQTADIVIYSEEGMPLVVPVGEDQVSHVELSREIVRSFNFYNGFKIDPSLRGRENFDAYKRIVDRLDRDSAGGRVLSEALVPRQKWIDPENNDLVLYGIPVSEWDLFCSETHQLAMRIGFDNFRQRIGTAASFFSGHDVLTPPDVMLTRTPRVPGLDGRKMSKSYGNAIMLTESDADIRAKTKVMVTDPARKRRSDPGNPDVCPVYDWHKLFSAPETLKWSAEGCRSAGIGCIECKAAMADNLIKWIAPIRERRVEYEKSPKRVLELIDAGSKRARVEAVKTMTRVREAVFGWDKKRKEISGGGTAANA